MVDLILRAKFPDFNAGQITLYQFPTVRPYTFDPLITDYREKVEPGFHGMKPLDFNNGRIDIYVVTQKNITPVSSAVILFNNGRAIIRSGGVPVVGALTDFGIWPLTGSADPAELYVETATANVSGHVTAAATRHSAIFAVHPNARYLGVGGKWLSMPGTGTYRVQYLKKVQLERAHIGGTYPTAYSQAREVTTRVRPDRLNYSVNPNFIANSTDWTAVSAVGLSSGTVVTHTIPKLTVGKRYLISVYVSSATPVSIVQTVSGGTQGYTKNIVTGLVPQRLVLQVVPVTAGSGTRTVVVTYTGSATGVTFSKMLVEQTDKIVPGEYFDGALGGDYLWETGGGSSNTRSYYYKNRIERYSAIKRILAENVPMGIGIDEPKFAVLPAN